MTNLEFIMADVSLLEEAELEELQAYIQCLLESLANTDYEEVQP